LAVAASGAAALAQDAVADFYRGKQITIYAGSSAGGGYDTYARLLGRHLGRYVPGNPTVVVANMPGAAGKTVTSFIANVAPRDGTVMHMIMQNMMAAQAVQMQGVEFDTRKLIWIGNTTSAPNVINSWHTSGITSIEQVRTQELVVGAPMGTAGALYPALLNAVAGMKFRLVMGYPGGNEVNLAMERGEVSGRGSNSWASWKSTKPEWLRDKKINILVQVGLKRHPDLPDVPLLMELATNPQDRKLLEFFSADTDLSRSLVTTPNVPAERVAALRAAFDSVMKDPEFLAEAARAGMDISPGTGADSQKVAESIVNASPEIIARAKAIMEAPAK
jgi:tripartite-type tricarboxylate transporter receptor subunit TctC